MGNGRVYGGENPPSPVPRGYALPGQGDRSPPKQVVVRSLRGIESPSATFGYFPSVESPAPQATEKTVTASARLFGIFTASRCDGRSLNPTFLLCKRKPRQCLTRLSLLCIVPRIFSDAKQPTKQTAHQPGTLNYNNAHHYPTFLSIYHRKNSTAAMPPQAPLP